MRTRGACSLYRAHQRWYGGHLRNAHRMRDVKPPQDPLASLAFCPRSLATIRTASDSDRVMARFGVQDPRADRLGERLVA